MATASALGGGTTAQPITVDEWFTVRTPSFLLYSNAEPQRAAEICGLLEGFRAAFQLLAPGLDLESPVPMTILAFRDARDFDQFKLGRAASGSRILGQFLTHPDGNYMTLDADPRYLGGFGVVLHEYAHHLVTHNFPRVPRWFNEGLAEYYSTFSIEGDQAVVGRPPQRHLDWLRRRGRIDLVDVLEADASATGHAALEVGHFYAVSWGLVHYLLSSGEVSSDSLASFLAAAATDPAPAELFEATFEVRIPDLEDRLRTYLLSETPPAAGISLRKRLPVNRPAVTTARPDALLYELAGLALRLGNRERAASLFELALAYEPRNPDAHAGLAHVRDLDLRFEEADTLFARALELGPTQARSFHLYGRHLLSRLQAARREGDRDRVAQLANAAASAFRAATAMDPDFAEALALLGYSHLFGDLRPADGVPPLERAIELLPARPDLVFHLMQLELRRGETARARTIAEVSLRHRGGDEWVARAEEEIERLTRLRQADAALEDGRLREALELIGEAIALTTDPDLRSLMQADSARIEARLTPR